MTYWQRFWLALSNQPLPALIFGFEEAHEVLSSPGMEKFEKGDGAVSVAIVATARLMGAKVVIAEEVGQHIDLMDEGIKFTIDSNNTLQTDLQRRIEELEEARRQANEDAQAAVDNCQAEIARAQRVKSVFGIAL
ncbi:MAG: hypothetical protein NT093_04295 [Candidatus Moranbacteria bacterium]|nr:hypothetical protein [Candidatus Moranbacteria bacterium]